MIHLQRLGFNLFYLYNLFDFICFYSEIKIINKKYNNITNLSFIYLILFNCCNWLSKILFFKNLVNMIFKNYKVIYKKEDKYYISDSFIIKSSKLESCFSCSSVNSIKITNKLGREQDIFNIIKKYDNDFDLKYFFEINNINLNENDKIVINFIPFFNLTAKEINYNDLESKKINYLLKN